MGLDQYAYASKRGVKKKEIAYWRKHPYLEGYMAQLYYDRGGSGEFNCKKVRLEEDDIAALQEHIEDNTLPVTGGFFFGSDASNEYREADIEFCISALMHINEGYFITYTSWW